MPEFADIAFAPEVRAAQARFNGGRLVEAPERPRGADGGLPEEVWAFLATRTSFYLASTGSDGWPYVQHRGGPEGFLRRGGPSRIVFPDYAGNRQFVTLGHLAVNPRVALIAVDYPSRGRLKLYAEARVVEPEAAPDLVAALRVPGYRGRVERAIVLDVAAYDWNCPQHITPRFEGTDVAEATRLLRVRLAEVEAERDALLAEREAARR